MNEKKSESVIREIKRRTRRKYSVEEKIAIVLEGLRDEESISALCRREGINPNLYYHWSKDFLASDKETGFARRQSAGWRMADLVDRYPGLAKFLESEGDDTLSCLNFLPQDRRRIRTTNGLELFNQEIKRRTSSAVAWFPNLNAALRLIGAFFMDQAEEWLTGRKYLDMSLLERGNHKQEADLKLDPAPWRGVAAESFLQNF